MSTSPQATFIKRALPPDAAFAKRSKARPDDCPLRMIVDAAAALESLKTNDDDDPNEICAFAALDAFKNDIPKPNGPLIEICAFPAVAVSANVNPARGPNVIDAFSAEEEFLNNMLPEPETEPPAVMRALPALLLSLNTIGPEREDVRDAFAAELVSKKLIRPNCATMAALPAVLAFRKFSTYPLTTGLPT